MSTETVRLIRDGEKVWTGVWRWEKRERDYIPIAANWLTARAMLVLGNSGIREATPIQQRETRLALFVSLY